jgi:hypothetical protein
MSDLNLEAPGLSSKCHVASKLTEEHRNDSVCPFLRSKGSCDSCDGGFATHFVVKSKPNFNPSAAPRGSIPHGSWPPWPVEGTLETSSKVP